MCCCSGLYSDPGKNSDAVLFFSAMGLDQAVPTNGYKQTHVSSVQVMIVTSGLQSGKQKSKMPVVNSGGDRLGVSNQLFSCLHFSSVIENKQLDMF